MGFSDPDVYYQPEKFGLTKLAEVELEQPSYSFWIAVVWKDEQGQYYVGEDSGCSCPSPFENATALSDIAGPMSRAGAVEWLKNQSNEYATSAIVAAIETVMMQ